MLLVVITICSIAQVVCASSINTGISGTTITPAGFIYKYGAKALGVVQYLCYAAAVIVTLIIGVKFMTAAPEGKAEVKKRSIYLAIGAGILFAIGGICTIISNTTDLVF